MPAVGAAPIAPWGTPHEGAGAETSYSVVLGVVMTTVAVGYDPALGSSSKRRARPRQRRDHEVAGTGKVPGTALASPP